MSMPAKASKTAPAYSPGADFSRAKRSIRNIYLMGLALDYCVKYSALDARQLGFNTHVILDGCRGIGLEPGDVDRALDEMKGVGATLLQSRELSLRGQNG